MSIFTVSKNSFEGQLPDEKVVFLTRKHWFTIFVPLFFAFILAVLPFALYFSINSLDFYSVAPSVYWFFVSVYFLILWNMTFYSIMIYFLNTLIVTNKRIIENKQKGFFKHTVNELEIDKIQDISVKVFGPLAEFLGFGNIEVQSAGAQAKFFFNQMPDPEKIKEIIRGQ
jgi:membrane protein YdbS with pleckstrin-like domain